MNEEPAEPVVAPPVVEAPAPAPGPPPMRQTSTMEKVVPTQNPPALIAYYLAVFGLIPGVCIILGPCAVILGFVGLNKIKHEPGLPGKAHAWVGIIGGILETVIALVLIGFAIFAQSQIQQ